jgi:hypothetical protein
MAGRGLAARACDAHDLELLRRLAEEHVGGGSHRRPRIADDDLRHRQVELAFDDERDRSALDRLRRKVVPVGVLAGHGEEDRAAGDPARVVGEIQHLDRRASQHLHGLERWDEALQVHPPECTRAR